jgi:hypothetical protein
MFRVIFYQFRNEILSLAWSDPNFGLADPTS